MAISRQSDSIWAEAAMGYGHQHNPARDEDHYGVGAAASAHGESMGRKHADEAFDESKHSRDAKGRFAPTSHHERERDHAASKYERRSDRDKFHAAHHTGFHTQISKREKEAKDKANKTSAVLAATSFDQLDPGETRHFLEHGTTEGYEPPPWLDRMREQSGEPDSPRWEAGQPTKKNPYKTQVDTLVNLANHPNLGLNLGMSGKAPFSPRDAGAVGGRKSDLDKYATLRPGEIASKPIDVTDHLGNTHTFVHHITAPNLNPIDADHPESGGEWWVNLHHHIKRPDGSGGWVGSETSRHVGAGNSVSGEASDKLQRDLYGQLEANSDMVSMYGAGFQRVGDKHTSVEYELQHPMGDVKYHAKLVNLHVPGRGLDFDPTLPEGHREELKGGPKWNLTGHALVRQYPHDPNSPTHMAMVEGSNDPNYGKPIMFKKDDLAGVIDHAYKGLGVGSPSWRRYLQHIQENTGGKPPEDMIRGSSVRLWRPEYNIHRTAERLPLSF